VPFTVLTTAAAATTAATTSAITTAYADVAAVELLPLLLLTSAGFPGYVYPNAEICAMYEGVTSPDSGACIYNEAKWGSAGVDNGAWPLGDRAFIGKALTSFDGLAPFPNSVFYNWATIVILGVGNLSALDFQVNKNDTHTRAAALLHCRSDDCHHQ
jgi:hypothetical protein